MTHTVKVKGTHLHMLFTSGKSPHSDLAVSVFEFFNTKYSIESDVEVFHTDLTEDNAFGFTEINGDEQFIQIHNDLSEKDYITTLMHELVHVVQNENGQFDDEEREKEAYSLESILFNQFTSAN
tara:strand:- start:762 stop:1133 length:372 start_codon:yes stop_codon:yes gene_type:complete